MEDYQTIKKVFRGKRKSNQSGLRRKPKRETAGSVPKGRSGGHVTCVCVQFYGLE
ncbi:hypothetical protein YC2023_097593 [Brassica napus]